MSGDPPAMRAFGAGDGDLAVLAGRNIAVIGYGNQGRSQALNLRDSLRAASIACDVTVATLRDETWQRAEADGFAVRPVPEAAQAADVIFLLVPDEDAPHIVRDAIAAHLRPNDAIVFASGYNLAFDGLALPAAVDVLMIAPRMIGRGMRLAYERGGGFYSYVSVEQDASGGAWPLLLALAQGIGTLAPPGAAFELSARDEALLDLFHEQGFGSILANTLMLMVDVGAKAGLPPEALILDLYLSGEAAETMQSMADLGFVEQARLHSRTSQYGGMMRTIGFDREPLRQHLERIIDEVRSGEFARQWAAERAAGAENFERIRSLAASANTFSQLEERIRAAVREAQSRSS